jgi:hypothetical protein
VRPVLICTRISVLVAVNVAVRHIARRGLAQISNELRTQRLCIRKTPTSS